MLHRHTTWLYATELVQPGNEDGFPPTAFAFCPDCNQHLNLPMNWFVARNMQADRKKWIPW